ncbi:hypothetical protein PHET_11876 [Paragonimus heterotremus]|uniref:Elongation factor Ts, mitochondrial n=1 Tax=Paragonimus heterotremus TaxID=100268 RepID=A0A8J4SSZ2_9TREM|nr:hypothetical protein PHET_11876 [Paragonimus heterotremus]
MLINPYYQSSDVRQDSLLLLAITWLNEEAVRRGWDKAGKVSNRALSHGLLGVLQHRSSAVIVEVNCETDFVARNEQFQTFVASLTETVMNEFKVSCA